jgi:hypothetical protein
MTPALVATREMIHTRSLEGKQKMLGTKRRQQTVLMMVFLK